MVTFNRILCPVDFSNALYEALQMANGLVKNLLPNPSEMFRKSASQTLGMIEFLPERHYHCSMGDSASVILSVSVNVLWMSLGIVTVVVDALQLRL
jgi:hypothetical protein